MSILLRGGPKFVGRAVADAALEWGHELTFCNRGRLVGDRAGSLGALAGRAWDAVIDTCGYLPRVVEASARALASSGLYCFVSSISVYSDLSRPTDEDSPTVELGDLADDGVTEESYSPLEALCEAAMRRELGEQALVGRPGNESVPWGDLLAACVDFAGADAETVRATLELAEPTEAAEPSSERGETLLAEWHGRP